MGTRLPDRQKWLEHALQGLAFWIGHRHSLFNGYPLVEGALVAEACNLIHANLPKDLILLPECLYRNLVPEGSGLVGVTGQSRADLVICSRGAAELGRNENISEHIRFVIEVKRASAPKAEIDADLLRLHNFLSVAPAGARALMFVVSESKAPTRFVSEGQSILGAHPIPSASGTYRVRRSVKAAASFSGKETAHYVCSIEVFCKDQPGCENDL